MNSNINPALIPRADVENLSHTFLSAVRRFYEDPEHVRAFEEWKRRRDANRNPENHQKTKGGKSR